MGRMVDAYLDSFASHHVRLDARLEKDVVVRADEELLETVFENVIDNALSVSPPNGAVAIELKIRNKLALVAVRDQGLSVPPPYLHRIFERYVSLRPAPDSADDINSRLIRWNTCRRTGPNPRAMSATIWASVFGLFAATSRPSGARCGRKNRIQGGLAVIIELPLAA